MKGVFRSAKKEKEKKKSFLKYTNINAMLLENILTDRLKIPRVKSLILDRPLLQQWP